MDHLTQQQELHNCNISGRESTMGIVTDAKDQGPLRVNQVPWEKKEKKKLESKENVQLVPKHTKWKNNHYTV